jgi:hypothetical protein
MPRQFFSTLCYPGTKMLVIVLYHQVGLEIGVPTPFKLKTLKGFKHSYIPHELTIPLCVFGKTGPPYGNAHMNIRSTR